MKNRMFSYSLGLGVLLLLWMAVGAGCSKSPAPEKAEAKDENHDGLPSIHEVVVVDVREDETELIIPEPSPGDTAPKPSKTRTPETTEIAVPKTPAEGVSEAAKPAPPKAEGKGEFKPKPAVFKGRNATSKEAKEMLPTLMDMANGVKSGDKALFVDAFDAGPKGKAYFNAFFDFVTAMGKFEANMKKTYGKEAEEVVAGAVSQKGPGMPTPEELKAKVRFEVNGDEAVAFMEGRAEPIRLAKKGGKWLIVMADLPVEEKELEMAIQMMKGMTGAVKKANGKIGKEGYTPKKIAKELGEEMMAAAFGGMIGEMPAQKAESPAGGE